MAINSPNEIVLDNENLELKINDKLDNLEQKSKVNQALGMLKVIDSQVPDFDIDMTYDKKNDKFYFISWNQKLNIPLNLSQIDEIWKEIVKLLNNKNKLWITWKQDFRRIFEVSIWSPADKQVVYKGTKFEWNTLNMDTAVKNNNEIEELYKFTQIAKWIPKENWVIEWWIWTPDEIWNK